MAEVISGGPPERPPADRASRVAVAVLASAAVLSAGTWVGLHRSSSTSAQRPPINEAVRTPTPTSPEQPAMAHLQPVLSGVSTSGPAGLWLLAGGRALTVVEAATGGRSAVAGVPLPPGGEVTQLMPVASGTLVVVQADQASGETGPGWVYLLRPGRAPVEVLRADQVVAGARPGRFWAFVYPRQQGAKATLTEVTTGGRLLSERKIPETWQLSADTGRGLLMAAYRQDGPGELMIVDPVSLRLRQSLGQVTYVVTATTGMAVWVTTGCPDSCALVVGSTRDGRRRSFRLGMDSGVGAAVFSPDERRLAIAYFGRHGGDRSGTPGFVEVLDLATGNRTRVPGVSTSEKQAADVTWSRDGRWLGIAVRWPDEGYQRIAVWPVSGGPVRELPGRLPARYSSALLTLAPPSAP